MGHDDRTADSGATAEPGATALDPDDCIQGETTALLGMLEFVDLKPTPRDMMLEHRQPGTTERGSQLKAERYSLAPWSQYLDRPKG